MSGPIACQEAMHRLWRYLDGALDAGDHQEVDRHLAFCLRCCGELEFARELQQRLRDTQSRTVPSEARARLERLIDDLGTADPATDGGTGTAAPNERGC